MRFLILIFVLITYISFAQQKRSWHFNNLGGSGVILNEGWKYKVGDDISWANQNYDDTSWENIDPTKDVTDLPQIQHGKIGWLRLHINIDSSLTNKQFGINIIQFIASEVFINGQLVQKYGQLDTTDVHANYVHENIILPRNTPKIVISVRFAYQKSLLYNRFGAMPNSCFGARLALIKNPLESDENWDIGNAFNFITVGLFLMMFIFHFALYLMFPAKKNNLYFSGLALFYIIFILSWSIYYFTSPIEKVELLMYFGIFRMMTFIITFVLLLIALYNIFDFKKDIIFWIVIGLNTLLLFNYLFISNFHVPFTELTTRNVNLLACLYISIKAVLLKKVNAKFILIGTLIAFVFMGIRSLGFWGVIILPMGIQGYFLFFGIISIPVSISCYLGGEFANISKKLRLKLKEVQDLSEEKQQILTTHNETLEKQVEQRTAELKASQNQLIQKEKITLNTHRKFYNAPKPQRPY